MMKNINLKIINIYNTSYEERYNYHKIFNNKLIELCIINNIKYIDLWDELTENDKVKDKYMKNKCDHHLMPSKELTNILYDKVKQILNSFI